MDQTTNRGGVEDSIPHEHIRALFWVYLVLFLTVWTAWVYLLYPLLRTLGEDSLAYALVNISIRLLIWVLPVLLLLRFAYHVDPFDYLKLKRNWTRGLLVGVAFSAINFLLSLTQYGWPKHTASLTWNNVLSTSLLIGIVEEIPFRGFIFQKLNETYSVAVAAIVSALLFLFIHLPGWFSLHMLRSRNVIFVFIFGLLMVLVFRLSKSLWGSIVAHSLNDFMASIIFRL